MALGGRGSDRAVGDRVGLRVADGGGDLLAVVQQRQRLSVEQDIRRALAAVTVTRSPRPGSRMPKLSRLSPLGNRGAKLSVWW